MSERKKESKDKAPPKLDSDELKKELTKAIDKKDSHTGGHSFESYTYTSPTYCDVCSQLLWGVIKQGQKCSVCDHNVHKGCLNLVKSSCKLVYKIASPPASPTSNSSKDSPSKLFFNSQVEVENTKTKAMLQEVNGPLSMQKLLKNNNRFVARQGPSIWLNDSVLSIVTWQKPAYTLSFMGIYVVLCIYPVLLLIVPQCLFLYIIIDKYNNKVDLEKKGKKVPVEPLNTPPQINPSSAQLLAAITFIQNVMGIYSEVYDAGYNLKLHLNWSYPEKTQMIFVACIISIPLTLITVYLIPVNYILLVGGVGFFLANATIVKAAGATLPLVINEQTRFARKYFKDMLMKKEETILISLFENQRWWVGAGFVPVLLNTERSPWTDDSGSVVLPPKELYDISTLSGHNTGSTEDVHDETAYDWFDSEWALDCTWSACDGEGWSYSDNKWRSNDNKQQWNSYTRRRKWVRKIKKINQKKEN